MRNTCRVATVAILLFRLSLAGAPVRASFLTDSAALQDTTEVLRSAGCTRDGVGAFRRAVERYSSSAFVFDLKKFPKPRQGFYSFESASGLVTALPHQLCDTPHAYEFNCFDTVIALATGFLRASVRPDDIAGPFLAPYTPTNGSLTILPKATARDAYVLIYPAWYREVTETAIPRAMGDDRISLTAVLFRCYLLPQSTTEEKLRDRVMDALRSSWRQQDVKFPSRFEVVLCHEVSLPQGWFVTSHAGLLFPRKRGCTYIEKGGGSGPFVRIDFDDRADLLTWLNGVFEGGERLGFTHHFASFNDTKVALLKPPKK